MAQRRRVVLITTFALLLLPGCALGTVPRPFFGVDAAISPLTERDFAAMRQSSVGTIRIPFSWDAVEPSRGARRWRPYDRLITQAARAHVQVLGVFVGSPPFAARYVNHPPRTARLRRQFRRFVRDAVARYGGYGSFWTAHRNLPYAPVSAWEIWNEPNVSNFWPGKPNPRAYARLLRAGAAGVRSADPDAKIVLAGLSDQGGVRGLDFLRALYKASPGSRRDFDVVALHPYASHLNSVLDMLGGTRRLMDRHGDRRVPIWITEVGWCTGGDSFTTTNASGQAERLSQTVHTLIRLRHRYRLEGVVWFSWRDIRPTGADSWDHHCGLYTLDGREKPALGVFRSITSRASRGWFRLG